MSTRLDKKDITPNSQALGYEGNDIPEDFVVPTCTLEDTDRAVFNLFNGQIPLEYKEKGEVKRIPVIFATGERFAVLRRKEPLRDKANALILPLISIQRMSVSQMPDAGHGPGQGSPITVKKRIAPETALYKRLKNQIGLKNQADTPSTNNLELGGDGSGAKPGTVATRRNSPAGSSETRSGKLLTPTLSDNIYEIITMPPVKFYQATYDVTFWAQYTQQMNDMLMAVMSTYQNNHARSFRLETDKGYWFVGYVGADMSPGNNYDDFTDNERLVRYNFEFKVTAYLVMPDYVGAPSGLRRTYSSPTIEFSTTQTAGAFIGTPISTVPNPDVGAHILQDIATLDDEIPGQSPGSSVAAAALKGAGVNVPGAPGMAPKSPISTSPGGNSGQNSRISGVRATSGGINKNDSASLGGFTAGPSAVDLLRVEVDPFTGKPKTTILKVKTRNQRKGETVYREGQTKKLSGIKLDD